MGKKILLIRTALLLVGLSILPALFVHCANKGFISNSKEDLSTVNGSVYQPPPGTGSTNYTCASTIPCSSGVSCALSIGRPSMENQAWQQGTTNCGFTCINGYTGPLCGTSPGGQTYSCQGAIPQNANLCDSDDQGLTTNASRALVFVCTPSAKCEYTCRPGYNLSNGTCVQATANSCAANPPCTQGTNCALNTGTPTAVGQTWVKDATTCGYSCINGYSGTTCQTAPTTSFSCQGTIPQNATPCAEDEMNLTANVNRTLVAAGQCSSTKCEYTCNADYTPQGGVCVASTVKNCKAPDPCPSSTCLIVRNPTSVNQDWTLNGTSCGYSCINGYTGATCNIPPGGTGVTKIACGSAVNEFPTTDPKLSSTHWNATTRSFSEGATGTVALQNTTDLLSSRKIYGSGLNLPNFNQYIADKYELSPITDGEWIVWSTIECQNAGMAVEFRRPSAYSDWGVARNAVVENRGSIQVLHALISDTNLATIILPPGWKKSDAPNKYPIMVTTSYDIKPALLASNHLIVQSMAKAWDQQRPFIGVIWNGGGAVGSRNMNDARMGFNGIMQKVAAHFGGNPSKIFMYGASRGGVASLLIAANPNPGYNYKVVAAYAGVPPTDFHSTINTTGATVPGLIASAEWATGLLDTWKSNFTYPTGLNNLGGSSRNDAHLKILTGSANKATLDSELSVSSPRILQGLKDQGVRLYIELSSHDANVPWVDQFRFMKALSNAGVPHQLRVNYMAGHWVDSTSSYAILNKDKFATIMKNIADGSINAVFDTSSKSYYMNDYSSGSMASLGSSGANRFTFELPSYQTPSTSGHFIFTGVPKTNIKTIYSYNGVDAEPGIAKLNDEGYLVAPLNLQPVGTLVLKKLFIQRDGGSESDWKEIDLRNGTTSLNRGTFTFEVKGADPDPNTSGAQITNSIMESYVGPESSNKATNGFREVTYGVTEK